jgi:hypothetical protein
MSHLTPFLQPLNAKSPLSIRHKGASSPRVFGQGRDIGMGMGTPIAFRGLACGEATDQLSHEADALKVIF